MKLLHNLAGLLAMLVLVAIGVLSVNVAYSVDRWGAFLELISDFRFFSFFGGIAIVLVPVIFFLTSIPGKKRERFLSIDQDGGTVSISTAAIADYLSKLIDEFPSIVKMTPEITPQRNSIDILIKVKVKAGPQIHEACELLQQRVRESMTAGLGISEIRRVEVSVRQIVSEHVPG